MQKGIAEGMLRQVSIIMSAGAALAFLCLFLLGCTPSTKLNRSEGKFLRMVQKTVPFYPQEDYQCGPSALAAVMNYWGAFETPEGIAREIYSRSARDTLTIDMLFYAQEKDFDVSQYSGSREDIRRKIDSGYPLIVLVDSGISIIRANHFMVIVGYAENGVIANSGKNEGLFIPDDEFLRSWERTRNWTLLVKPKKAF